MSKAHELIEQYLAEGNRDDIDAALRSAGYRKDSRFTSDDNLVYRKDPNGRIDLRFKNDNVLTVSSHSSSSEAIEVGKRLAKQFNLPHKTW